MSKDYTQKIRNLLNESSQTVPYIFERFYTVLKNITLSIRHDNNDQKIFQHYSLIYRTLRKYVVDQPMLGLGKEEKIEKELKALLAPLMVHVGEDPFAKQLYQFFADKENNAKVGRFLLEAEKVKAELMIKNLKLKVFGIHEMSNAFWVRKFKNQYAVHVDTFWNAFLQFIQEIDFFESFISLSSKKSIIKKVDPQKKYFITSSNVSQLFYKLSEPQYLQKLADQTAKGVKPSNFISKDFLQLRFLPNPGATFQTQLTQKQQFEIGGDQTLISGKQTKTKQPPTIIFGSSVDSDVKIKNKYVSRKQFMIIEEDDKIMGNSKSLLPFSLVCLSSSNFTMVSYDRDERAKTGMIFKLGENSLQIVKILNCFKEVPVLEKKQSEQKQSDQDDETLEYLPTKSSHQISDEKQLEYLCISGPQKGIKGIVTKQKNYVTLRPNQQSQQISQKFTLVELKNDFYLPPGTSILVKTANQVINGELSDKIPLEEGMKILLEECQFEIV